MHILIIILGLVFTPLAHADSKWTIHTVSTHLITDDMNNVNPGLAYDVREDIRIGALYNSYNRPSLYAAKIFPIHDRVRVGLGVITGYGWDSDEHDVYGKTTGVIPLLALELDVTKHVSIIWFGEALNLELKF